MSSGKNSRDEMSSHAAGFKGLSAISLLRGDQEQPVVKGYAGLFAGRGKV